MSDLIIFRNATCDVSIDTATRNVCVPPNITNKSVLLENIRAKVCLYAQTITANIRRDIAGALSP